MKLSPVATPQTTEDKAQQDAVLIEFLSEEVLEEALPLINQK